MIGTWLIIASLSPDVFLVDSIPGVVGRSPQLPLSGLEVHHSFSEADIFFVLKLSNKAAKLGTVAVSKNDVHICTPQSICSMVLEYSPKRCPKGVTQALPL